jgi:hypothetical protein
MNKRTYWSLVGALVLLGTSQGNSAIAGCEKALLNQAEALNREHDFDHPVLSAGGIALQTIFTAGIALPFVLEERVKAKKLRAGYIYLAQVIREAGDSGEKAGPWLKKFTKDVNEHAKKIEVQFTEEEVAIEVIRMDRKSEFCTEHKPFVTAKEAARRIGGAI